LPVAVSVEDKFVGGGLEAVDGGLGEEGDTEPADRL